jgi:hypothetical protein
LVFVTSQLSTQLTEEGGGILVVSESG